MDEQEALATLELLMEEFFSHSTGNLRKQEIEREFNSFKLSPHSWKLCLYFITRTSSQYVVMFSLSILETVITQQWENGDLGYKDQLQRTLYEYLIENGTRAPHFIREKYAKLLVDIAREDWPCSYPNFMDNILELLRTEPNLLIGLILLRTTSEEFTSVDNNLDKDRRDELTRLLRPYIPGIFETLHRILIDLEDKPRHSATATPPPSPTYPSTSTGLSVVQHPLVPSAPFRPDPTKTLHREILRTIQHLFTWVPIEDINPKIVACVFNLTNISSYAQEDNDLSVLAMSTINELLYRKCMPPGTEAFFTQLYRHTFELLRDLSIVSVSKQESIDSTYMEKLSELIVLLIQQHFWRLELDREISTIEFLSFFYQLTIQLQPIQCYCQCLVAWEVFVKQLKPENLYKYFEVLRTLISMLLDKLQYAKNVDQLRQFDDADTDADDTERRNFVDATNEILAAIADFDAAETLFVCVAHWREQFDAYERTITTRIEPDLPPDQVERFCYMLRDVAALTRTMGRLSSAFVERESRSIDLNASVYGVIHGVFEQMLATARSAALTRLYRVVDKRIAKCFCDFQCELMASIQTWLYWVVPKERLEEFDLERLVNTTVPVLLAPEVTPTPLLHAVARLFQSMTSQMHLFIFARDKMFDLVRYMSTPRYESMEVTKTVFGAICNIMFLREWAASGEYAVPRHMIPQFFSLLTRNFRQLTASSDEQAARDTTQYTLEVLAHCINHCKLFPNNGKKMLFAAIEETIEHALVLFPVYVKYPDVAQYILQLFVAVLDVLQQHLGVDGTKRALDVFLKVAIDERQVVTTPANVEKLLQVFKLVVEAPGSSYRTFMPAIVEMCLCRIAPVAIGQADEYPEVCLSLLDLFYSMLLHRWQYFYMSQVRSGFSPCVEADASDFPQKPEELVAILQIFGQALLQKDFNIYKLSVGVLEDLNAKWNLYSKGIIREHLLGKFLTVLLSTLMDKTHCLLSEDTQVAIYNMASVSFPDFFATFLTGFMGNFEGVSPDQAQILLKNFAENHDKDMPTFIQNLRKFVKDGQRFRMRNSKG